MDKFALRSPPPSRRAASHVQPEFLRTPIPSTGRPRPRVANPGGSRSSQTASPPVPIRPVGLAEPDKARPEPQSRGSETRLGTDAFYARHGVNPLDPQLGDPPRPAPASAPGI